MAVGAIWIDISRRYRSAGFCKFLRARYGWADLPWPWSFSWLSFPRDQSDTSDFGLWQEERSRRSLRHVIVARSAEVSLSTSVFAEFITHETDSVSEGRSNGLKPQAGHLIWSFFIAANSNEVAIAIHAPIESDLNASLVFDQPCVSYDLSRNPYQHGSVPLAEIFSANSVLPRH